MLALAVVAFTILAGLVVSAPGSRANHETIPWSPATFVAGHAGFIDSYPTVLPDGRGYVYVFYVTYNTVSSVANINVTKYFSVGTYPMFDKQVNSVSDVVDGGPVAATVDHSGNLLVAWRRLVASNDQIWLSKSTDGGVTWQAAVRVSGSSTGSQDSWPAITTTSTGAIYVGWVRSWGGYAVTVARSTDGGSSFSAPLNVTSREAYISSVSLASDAGGRVYLSWGGIPPASTWLTNVTWSDDGVLWAPQKTLSTTTYPGFFPALYADASSTIHLSWFSQVGSDFAIRYSRSLDRGATWSPAVVTIPEGYGGGALGYLGGEGDTVMYAYATNANVLAFAVSGDRGASWYPAETVSSGPASTLNIHADQNDTIWGTYEASDRIYVMHWAGPPSAPALTSVAPVGANGLTVTWKASPEPNVQEFRVYRCMDGSTYEIIAVVPASATSYTDTGLANGTYWYKVDAVNGDGTPSHASGAWSGVVGPTTAQLIANLQAQINALQSQLSAANANLAAIQTQLNAVKSQLNAVQGNTTALQSEINTLQQRLSDLQAQQATQTISYAILAFEVIVVGLLGVLLVNQMRRPKRPQTTVVQPAQAAPSRPEDEL